MISAVKMYKRPSPYRLNISTIIIPRVLYYKKSIIYRFYFNWFGTWYDIQINY